MKRFAVLVGINYPNTEHELRGCVNDVDIMNDMLTTHFGFKPQDISVLIDEQATTKNILQALEDMVAACQPGDNVFFQFSGHGSQIYDRKTDDDVESDGLDEILCPIDLNWRDKVIRDDDLKRIFDKISNGVHFTVVLDCCNSGSGLDHDVQYQPLVEVGARGFETPVVEHSSRFLPPPEEMISEAQSRRLSLTPHEFKHRDINKTGMLISGCRADQTSADALIGGRYVGACTHFLTTILREHNYDMSYRDLIDELNKRLARHGFTQRPELNGPESMHDHPFVHCDHHNEDVVQRPNNVVLSEQHESLPEVPHGFWQKIVYWKKFDLLLSSTSLFSGVNLLNKPDKKAFIRTLFLC